MAKIYYEKDADMGSLKGLKTAVIGYGIQGRGQALNLRDSGVDVIVSQRKGGANYELAVKDGFTPVPVRSTWWSKITSVARTLAAAGIGSPVKYLLSAADTTAATLNRANRSAPHPTKANMTADPAIPCALNAQA